jgi:rhodanese-related sulfurtransferase
LSIGPLASAVVFAGLVLALSSRAGAAGQTPAAAAPTAAEGAAYCPILAGRAAQPAQAIPTASTNASCLIDVGAVRPDDRLYDLRDRADFAEFHLPGAASASLSELLSQAPSGKARLVVYDSGRFRSDASMLCDQLQAAGLANAKVMSGGIAAWAQVHEPDRALLLTRLSDGDLPGVLAQADVRARTLAPSLAPALGALAGGPAKAGRTRLVFLADATTPIATIQAQLAKSKGAFYWIGTPDRLRTQIANHLAMDKKRVAGPAQAAACSAL